MPLLAAQLLFNRQAQVVQQMEAIGDLARLRGAASRTLRINSAPAS
jgi:hypothetical protein